jgi:hypothetical protein
LLVTFFYLKDNITDRFANFIYTNTQIMRFIIILLAATFAPTHSSAQFLNKLKQKAEQKAEQALDKKLGLGQSNNSSNNQNSSSTNAGSNSGGSDGGTRYGKSNPSNKGGGGLVSAPPDVNQNLADAEAAYKKGTFGDARYSIQQAILGVELEIGNQILKSLPETVAGLKKDETQDEVSSNGFGWAGLTIQRKYLDDKDKQLTFIIANNAAWMAANNAYMNMGGMAQQTNGQQNWKQTKFKGNRAIIEYSESSGYKLSAPIGQSSLLVFEGINFKTEPDFMKAANEIDADSIKKQLGEQ